MPETATSLMKLATVIALCGLVPAGAALASDHGSRTEERRHERVTLSGTVQEVWRESLALRTEDGRAVTVKAEACAADLSTGQVARFIGHWQRNGRFEADWLVRAEGNKACDRDHGWQFRRQRHDNDRAAAVAAPVNAGAAIAAVERQGYQQVTAVEWEDGGWRLRATDREGREVRLLVDGASGQVSEGRGRR